MDTIRSIRRGLFGLALAALAPGLACDPSLDLDTQKQLAAAGLRIRETDLIVGADGLTTDRRHAGGREERTALLGRSRTKEHTQVVTRRDYEPTTVSRREVVLFDGAKQASSFLASHGVDASATRTGNFTLTFNGQTTGWLNPTDRPDVLLPGTRDPGGDDGPGGLVGVGSGVAHGAADDWSSGETPSVTRYVMNDDLPLHAQPDFDSAEVMRMQRGDRVLVFANAPVPADGNVFVQVQAADRAPNPVGWMPLHWLVVSPRSDAPVTVDFEASYGLISKMLQGFVEDTFYEGCDRYPTYAQQDVVASTPELEDPASIPYAERYLCGEIPFGEVKSSNRKLVTNFAFSTPSAYYELAGVPVVDIESIDIEVPVMLYRLPYQTLGSYSIRDMSTGWSQQFGDGSADVVEYEHYQKLPGGERNDAMARIHDSDVWFNVTWNVPPGVQSVAGAQAYFNLCWMLPGGRLEGEVSDLDVDIYSPGAHSHVTGVHWGVADYAPFRVCATAALSAVPDAVGDPDDLTTAPASPIRVDLVRASLHDVSITFSEPIDVYGSFAGVHGLAIAFLTDFLGDVQQHQGAMGLLWEALLESRIETMLAAQLHDVMARLAASIPNPEDEIHGACNRLMPASYREPTSRWYPFYQHCLEASRNADVTLFSNAIEHTQSCHDRPSYARANDGSAWTRRSDDHDVYYQAPDGDPIGIDRPYWVTGCEVEAEVDTTVMSGYEDLIACAADALDEGINFMRSQSWIAGQAQSRCLTPAVGLLCELYGEGEDLIAMWSEELGVEPNLDGYTNFCDWYDSLTAPDLPDFTIDPD